MHLLFSDGSESSAIVMPRSAWRRIELAMTLTDVSLSVTGLGTAATHPT